MIKAAFSRTKEASRTSSQTQKEILLAKFRREEVEKQNENASRITNQTQEMELRRQEIELERSEEIQSLKMAALCEENRRKLAEAKLHELEQIDDVSQASQDLLEEVSQATLDDETRSNRVEQWLIGSTSHCDQHPLGGYIEAEEETHASVTANNNQPQLPSTSNKLTFL